MPFTTSNYRFSTNTDKGLPHGSVPVLGCVLPYPLVTTDIGETLWLEYANDTHGTGGWKPEPMWLVWYKPDGEPATKASAAFDRWILRRLLFAYVKSWFFKRW